MSYILDALKASQQEREQREVPSLNTRQPGLPPTPDQPSKTPLVATLVLVLIGAGVGWWYGMNDHSSDTNPHTVVTLEKASSPPPVETVYEEKALPEESALLQENTPDSSMSPVVEKVSNPLPPEQKNQVIQETRSLSDINFQEVDIHTKATHVSNSADVTLPDETAITTVIAKEKPMIEPITDSEQLAPEESIDATDSESKVPPITEPKEKVPHIRELPYDIQAELPDIAFSVHLYAPEPAHRMVKINGLVRREGTEVFPGITLVEITPYGAVFVYRDYKFRVPIQ